MKVINLNFLIQMSSPRNASFPSLVGTCHCALCYCLQPVGSLWWGPPASVYFISPGWGIMALGNRRRKIKEINVFLSSWEQQRRLRFTFKKKDFKWWKLIQFLPWHQKCLIGLVYTCSQEITFMSELAVCPGLVYTLSYCLKETSKYRT